MSRRLIASLFIVCMGLCAPGLRADTMVRDAGGNVIYQYSNGVMFEGTAGNGKKVFKYDGRSVITSPDGSRVLATWQGNALYPENKTGGQPLYVFADKGGHPQSAGNQAIVYIDGRKIHHGAGPGGKLILYPDEPLPEPVALYLFHIVTGGKAPEASKLNVDINTVPFGYYLGEKGEGKILLAVRGSKIYFGEDMKQTAYTMKNLKFYKGDDTDAEPAFCMDEAARMYRGGSPDPANMVMHLEWFNCFGPGKTGTDAIGTLQYVGENILTEGYTEPSQHPDFTGRRVLLSSTLPNDKVDMAIRIFLIYLSQLDPEFRQYVESQE